MLWFKKKDPVCGMKEEDGKGIGKHGEWFCSDGCLKNYEKSKKSSRRGCC